MITVDSKIKEILKYPEAKKVFDDAMAPYVASVGGSGNYSDDPQLARAYNMTLRALAGFPQSGIAPEVFAEIEEKLEELEIDDDDDED